MDSLPSAKTLIFKRFLACLGCLAAVCVASSALAQSDPYGEVDLFYIDSVEAAPGQDVPVRFHVKNDEPLSTLSLPIAYDPDVLTLKSVSFAGSRGEYIGNKSVTPSSPDSADGHFLVVYVIFLEDPLPVGDGLMFTALFGVSDSARVGSTAILDSLFYPPVGELVFVEATSLGVIYPAFKPGKIVIGDSNKPPVIGSIPTQYVFEGDSLVLDVAVSDPNGDQVVLVCTDKPSGSSFEHNGDGAGTFRWQPDYIGPNSADGSPFTVRLWASDGDLSDAADISVNVINRNRRPVIVLAESVEAESGDLLELSVSAYDPDFEPISWQVLGLPTGADFDNQNPGLLNWPTRLVDTGSFDLAFVASDPQGSSDTARLSIYLVPTPIYVLSLDTVSAYPGDVVPYDISLDNKFPVGSFNVLFSYDPTVLSINAVTARETRAEAFEYFNVVFGEGDNPGHVRIVGIADYNGDFSTPLLGVGDGPIATASFRISRDLSFSGMTVPARFRFLDDATLDDNTLTDSVGSKIEQAAIVYRDGYVFVLEMGEVKLGDINLNGIAFEIGDAIYFSNYFMNPVLYSLDPLQYANSDVNRDGIGATIADLVVLINTIVDGSNRAKSAGQTNLKAVIRAQPTITGIELVCEADFEVGAIFMTLRADEDFSLGEIRNFCDQMELEVRQDGSEVRLLLYSLGGNRVGPGEYRFAGIGGLNDAVIESVEMAGADGCPVEVRFGRYDAALPGQFRLCQNYPNPFNPETRIDFDLPEAGEVRLAIYNILGRKVTTLIDEKLPAGANSVVWDSRDDSGQPVASGVYLYQLETEAGAFTRKMLLLK